MPLRRRQFLKRVGQGAAGLAAAAVGDSLLYSHLPVPGKSGNRGRNGLWLRYRWYFGERSEAEIRALGDRLRRAQIRSAFFHIRHVAANGALRYRFPDAARRLTETLRASAPEVLPVAWVYAGNNGGGGLPVVRLADAGVRDRMVEEARWLVRECGFAGVQWDYEICREGDDDFLRLLRATRTALPEGALLSVSTPVWLPRLFARWGWSEVMFQQVGAACDQLAVMGYDTGLYLPRAYAWLIARQVEVVTRAAAAENPACRVLIGLPTYARGGASHFAPAENLAVGLRGVRAGVAAAGAGAAAFEGVALFADYTTQPEEWATYHALWLEERTP